MSAELPDESQIVAYLKNNKNFFDKHTDLLVEMTVPHASGSAISLVERQVGVLKERNLEMRERLQHLLDVARENDVLFEKMRGLVLSLLEAKSISDVVAFLERELKARFQSEFISFLLFDTKGATGAAYCVRLQDAQDHMPTLIKGRQAIAGQLRTEELAFLFGHEGTHVKSCAVVPLNLGRPLGLLAIGSSDIGHFRTSMDTMFISFVGEVLARIVEPMLETTLDRHIA